MLTTGFGNFDAAEFCSVSHYPHILETLRADQLCIFFVLGEQRDVFGQCFLCGIVPQQFGAQLGTSPSEYRRMFFREIKPDEGQGPPLGR